MAVSLAVKEDLVKQGYSEKLIEVIPNGMDPTPFQHVDEKEIQEFRSELGVGNDETLFGVVARLSPQKDVSTFLRAMAKQSSGCHAFIAGSGPLASELKKFTKDLGLTSHCHFLGFRQDVPLLLRSCDVFVLPSRWEGLPLTVLEAMACAKPVVATAVDGTKEAVMEGKTGYMTAPGDWQHMATAMEKLARDPNLRETMGRAGYERLMAHFLQQRVTDHHLRLYEEVLA